MNAIPLAALAPSDCHVHFGGLSAGLETNRGLPALRVALPVLAGAAEERLLAGAETLVLEDDAALFQRGPWYAGFAVAPPERNDEAAARAMYHRLFALTAGLHLYRICNYVPQINALTAGEENYQRFCRARSLAFEERFGAAFQQALPAAAAIGAVAGPLAIGFVAGALAPQHFENPQQVPAFAYPRQYGPRSPSFSRATAVEAGGARRIFISGTAAIRGHASVAAQNLAGQVDCTLENLALIGAAAGAGRDLGAAAGGQRAFKVYLRHARDFKSVRAELERRLLRAADAVSYLQADICRAELLVEIEATVAL